MAENRRVRMTKRIMKDALLELMEEKPFEKIRVTDVCAAAEVNRSTFYAHYSDTRGLLTEIEDELIERSPGVQAGEEYDETAFLGDLEQYFEFIKHNARVFRILLIQRGSDEFNRRLIDAVMRRYRPGPARAAERYAYAFCVCGVIGILKDWLDEGFPVSSAEFAALVLRLCARAAGSC